MKVVVKSFSKSVEEFANVDSWSDKELANKLNDLLGNPKTADTQVIMGAEQCTSINEKYNTNFQPYTCKVTLKSLYNLIKNAPIIDVKQDLKIQDSMNSESASIVISKGKIITKSNKSPNNGFVNKLSSILDNKRVYTNASKVVIELGVSSDNYGIFGVKLFKSNRLVTDLLFYILFTGYEYELVSKDPKNLIGGPLTFKSLENAQDKLMEYADRSIRYALFRNV